MFLFQYFQKIFLVIIGLMYFSNLTAFASSWPVQNPTTESTSGIIGLYFTNIFGNVGVETGKICANSGVIVGFDANGGIKCLENITDNTSIPNTTTSITYSGDQTGPTGEITGGAFKQYLTNMFGNIETGTGKICANSGAIIGFANDGTPQCGKVIHNTGTASWVAGVVPAGISVPSVIMQTNSIPNSRVAGLFGNILNRSCAGDEVLVGFKQTGELECRKLKDLSDKPVSNIDLSSNSGSVLAESTIILTWTTTGVHDCTLGGNPVNLNGSQEFTIHTNTTFSLVCIKDDTSGEIKKELSVTIIQLDIPQIEFKVATGGTMIIGGEERTLSWNVSKAQKCSASNSRSTNDTTAWYGERSLSGTFVVSPVLPALSPKEDDIPYTMTYYLTCEKGSEKVTAEVTLGITSPIASFTSSSYELPLYRPFTLDWHTTNNIVLPKKRSYVVNGGYFQDSPPCAIAGPGLLDFSLPGNNKNVGSLNVESSASMSLQGTTVGDRTYTLLCYNSKFGLIGKKSLTMKVLPSIKFPSISFFYDGNIQNYGNPQTANQDRIYTTDNLVRLQWYANNADVCHVSGIPQAYSGSSGTYEFSIHQNDVTKEYTLQCYNSKYPDIVDSRTLTIVIDKKTNTNPEPKIDHLWAANNNANGYTKIDALGQISKAFDPYVTLDWSADNVVSCEQSWTPLHGAKTIQAGPYGTISYASQATLPDSGSQVTYSVECLNKDGASIQKSLELNVMKQPVVPVASISFTGSNEIPKNTTAQITWNTENIKSCKAMSNDLTWSGSQALSGTFITQKLSNPTLYILNCIKYDGGEISKSIEIKISTGVNQPVLSSSPVIDVFWATTDYNTYHYHNDSPTIPLYQNGGWLTFYYRAKNVNSCRSSWIPVLNGQQEIRDGDNQDLFVDQAISYQTQAQLPNTGSGKDIDYTVTCTNSGSSIDKTIRITLRPPSELIFGINKLNVTNVSQGQTSYQALSGMTGALSWNTTNVSSCTASGDWSGTKASSGTYTTPVLTSNKSYTMTCAGLDGISRTQTLKIDVITPQTPTIAFGVTTGGTSIKTGESRTLSWNISNADSCTASEGWTGELNGIDTLGVSPSSTTKYVITCEKTTLGTKKTAAAEVTIAVLAKPFIVLEIIDGDGDVNYGESRTIRWNVSNAVSCERGGGSSVNTTSLDKNHPWLKADSFIGTMKTQFFWPTTYSLICHGLDGSSVLAWIDITIKPLFDLNLTTVNDKEGYAKEIHWNAKNLTTYPALKIHCNGYGDRSPGSDSNGWNGMQSASGKYIIPASAVDPTTYTMACALDFGDIPTEKSITISSHAPITQQTLSLDLTTINDTAGNSIAITWDTKNATSCYNTYKSGVSRDGDQIAEEGSKWVNAKGLSGTYTLPNLVGKTYPTYSVVCFDSGGNSLAKDVTPDVTPIVASGLSFVSSSSQILSGATSTLSWNTTNVSSCTASGDWNSTKTLTGTYTTPSLTSNKSYTLTCEGKDGILRIEKVNIEVITPQTPTIAFGVTTGGTSIKTGESRTLSWNISNADSCTASEGWTGELNGIDTLGVSPSSTTKYVITCEKTTLGTKKTAAAEVTIAVTSSVELNLSTTKDTAGYTTAIAWDTKNATSCSASGGSAGWSDIKGLNGTYNLPNLTSNTTYTMTCIGMNGSSLTKGVTMVVEGSSNSVIVDSTQILEINLSTTKDTAGYTTAIAWDTKNATSCSASGGSAGWSDIKGLNGTYNLPNLTSNTTYTMTCIGMNGSSLTKDVTMVVEGSSNSVMSDTTGGANTNAISKTCPNFQYYDTTENRCLYQLSCFQKEIGYAYGLTPNRMTAFIYWNDCGHTQYIQNGGSSQPNFIKEIIREGKITQDGNGAWTNNTFPYTCPQIIKDLNPELCTF